MGIVLRKKLISFHSFYSQHRLLHSEVIISSDSYRNSKTSLLWKDVCNRNRHGKSVWYYGKGSWESRFQSTWSVSLPFFIGVHIDIFPFVLFFLFVFVFCIYSTMFFRLLSIRIINISLFWKYFRLLKYIVLRD